VTLRIHPEARHEFQRAAAYYRTISPALAARFILEVESAFKEIALFPNRFAIKIAPARAKPLDVFPFLVHFFEEENTVHVIAVAHTKRRPGYWLDRIEV